MQTKCKKCGNVTIVGDLGVCGKCYKEVISYYNWKLSRDKCLLPQILDCIKLGHIYFAKIAVIRLLVTLIGMESEMNKKTLASF